MAANGYSLYAIENAAEGMGSRKTGGQMDIILTHLMKTLSLQILGKTEHETF